MAEEECTAQYGVRCVVPQLVVPCIVPQVVPSCAPPQHILARCRRWTMRTTATPLCASTCPPTSGRGPAAAAGPPTCTCCPAPMVRPRACTLPRIAVACRSVSACHPSAWRLSKGKTAPTRPLACSLPGAAPGRCGRCPGSHCRGRGSRRPHCGIFLRVHPLLRRPGGPWLWVPCLCPACA